MIFVEFKTFICTGWYLTFMSRVYSLLKHVLSKLHGRGSQQRWLDWTRPRPCQSSTTVIKTVSNRFDIVSRVIPKQFICFYDIRCPTRVLPQRTLRRPWLIEVSHFRVKVRGPIKRLPAQLNQKCLGPLESGRFFQDGTGSVVMADLWRANNLGFSISPVLW